MYILSIDKKFFMNSLIQKLDEISFILENAEIMYTDYYIR